MLPRDKYLSQCKFKRLNKMHLNTTNSLIAIALFLEYTQVFTILKIIINIAYI